MKIVSSAVLSAFTQATVWPRSKPYLTKNESAQTPVRVAALVEYVKVCRNDGIELRNIVRTCGSEYCAHCVFNLSLLGGEGFLLSSHGGGICREEKRK